jgi:two-component system, chemotaxis family, response regulator Rcp1
VRYGLHLHGTGRLVSNVRETLVKGGQKFMVILLVEDDVGEAKLTREALCEAGLEHQLYVVADGEAATRFLRNDAGYEDAPKPNVVLLDLNLPRKHGREVLADIKRDLRLCRVPVIVISNSDAMEDIDEVYQLGGSGYLVKSGDLDEYFASVKAMVEFWMRRSRLPTVLPNNVHPAPLP